MNFNRIKNLSRKEIIYSILAILAIAALAFLFSLQCPNNIWKTSSAGTDSSVFKYIGRVILDGGIPYRDTFDHKGPLVYLLNAIGILISYQKGIWGVELVTLFATFAIMYKISRLLCSRLVSIGILLLSSSLLFKYFEHGNLSEEFALPFIAAAIYIFTDYFIHAKISNLRLVICGLSLGAVCLLRVNMIPVWVVMCIGVLIHCITKRQIKEIFRFLAFFLIGFSIIILPVAVWLTANGAFQSFIDDYIVFNSQYSSFDSPVMALSGRGSTFLAFLNETITLLALALLVYRIIKNRKFYDVLYTVYFLANIVFLSLSGNLFLHYGMIIIPALVYPFAIICRDCRIGVKSQNALPSVAFLYVLATLAMPGWLNGANTVFQDLPNIGVDQINANDLQIATLVSTHSAPDDKILVCGNYNLIYNLSERFAATKYSYQSPPLTIDEEKAAEYYREISKNLPKVIVLPQNTFGYDEIRQFVKENHYKKAGKNDAGNVTVYVHSP